MKLTTLLLFIPFFQVAAHSYAQETRLNLKFEKETLENVFSKIEQNSNFSIFYKNELIKNSKEVSGEFKDALIFEVLDQILKTENLTYSVKDKLIMIVAKESETNATTSQQQGKKVTGKVTDSTGGSLPGVSIVIKGTTTGVITDNNGNFSLALSSDAKILTFSFVGMKSQEVEIGIQKVFNITMEEAVTGLEEVVAIGYGTVKKSDLTGVVASVKSDEIKAFATSNVMQSLSGRAPGVQVMQNTGAPGGAVSVRIRGTNSIQGSSEPLYVIDGFPYSSSNPSVLSNNDIESVEILKDASSTAIYGSRGANGVVLITTKRGKSGKTTVDFESSYGIQTLRKKLNMMNAKEYASFYNEQATNDKLTPYFTQDQINGFGEGYDWQDFVFEAAPIKNNALSINGGNEKTQFSVSGTVFDQQGIIKGSDYKKYSISAHFTHEINKMLSLEYGATLTKNTASNKNSVGGGRGGSLISSIISTPPTLTPYNDDGSYKVINTAYTFISSSLRNPINFINEQKNNDVSNIALANAAFSFKPIEGLTLKIYGGIENDDSRNDSYTTLNYIQSSGDASVFNSSNVSILNENTLSYNKSFMEKHNIGAVVGFTYQDFLYQSLGGSGAGFLSDITETYDLGSAITPGIPSSNKTKSVILSYLGRVNYSFNNKYLFTFSMRADGSSKYSEGNKWGYFPSGAFAWKVKEENFLKNFEFISDLKLRTSYGFTGSQAINAYATLNQLFSGKTVFGNTLYTTYAPGTTMPNNLKWETTKQLDVGVDISFINNRFRLTVDAYRKNTHDLLNTVKLPSSLGFTQTIQNVGQIRNQGLEFSLDSKVLKGKFEWDINANITINRNEVIKLYGGQDILSGTVGQTFVSDNSSLLREGEPISVFYGYQKDGYDAAGKEIYKDLSGSAGVPDGLINQFDKQIIGDPNPDFIYGLNSSMTFRKFEFNFFFQGSQGNDIVGVSAAASTLDYAAGVNMPKDVYNDHWTVDNTDAKYPVLSRTSTIRYSDRFVSDGSYLRLRNIQLAYNLPLKNWGINGMRNVQIYASGQNLLTITKYFWWDPEVNSAGGSNSVDQGIDYYSYPTAKTITFGIKIGF